MKKEIQSGIITLLLVALALLLLTLVSCSPKICKTPTRREIAKGMSYSSWQYILPNTKN
jgi:hypothetical protein